MYCSTCGNQIADHLNYCSSCGARIEKISMATSDATSRLAKPLAVVVMMGLVGFVAVLKIVLDNGRLDVPGMVMILLGYLAALTIIASTIVRHMWRIDGEGRVISKLTRSTDEYAPPPSFRGPNTNQLVEPTSAPIGSVTDSTTRTLDEVYVEARK